MSDNLPDYKQTFLREMEELRRKEQLELQLSNQQAMRSTLQQAEKPPSVQHELWNQTQYSDANWRNNLTQTFYRQEHNEQQHHMNSMLNPEVHRKKHNVRVTQISEYSNAKHNNTVFINPKHGSC